MRLLGTLRAAAVALGIALAIDVGCALAGVRGGPSALRMTIRALARRIR